MAICSMVYVRVDDNIGSYSVENLLNYKTDEKKNTHIVDNILHNEPTNIPTNQPTDNSIISEVKFKCYKTIKFI